MKIRVLTFQSSEVLDILFKDGIYKADILKCREKRSYSEDINTLNGDVPIWCFCKTDGTTYETNDFLTGELFERFKCEMSLKTKGLAEYKMLELELEDSSLKLGKTHNSYLGAKIIQKITMNNLCAVYELNFNDHWYYPSIVLINRYRPEILFQENFKFIRD